MRLHTSPSGYDIAYTFPAGLTAATLTVRDGAGVVVGVYEAEIDVLVATAHVPPLPALDTYSLAWSAVVAGETVTATDTAELSEAPYFTADEFRAAVANLSTTITDT